MIQADSNLGISIFPMDVLLKILLETVLLIGFLWIGKSIMKAEVTFKTLFFTGFAGALASQVPFVGMYVSFAVVLFFMWKMARVDMVPDGVLIVIIGKGCGLIIMIYAAALFVEQTDTADLVSGVDQIPIYTDDEGTRYFTEGEKVYYLDENEEQVFVDANELFGISDVMEVADSDTVDQNDKQAESDTPSELPEVVALENKSDDRLFSEPLLSDSVVRGSPQPFEVYVPQGWMISKKNGEIAIRFEDHTYLNYYSQTGGLDNKSYLRDEVNRVMSNYGGYELAKQEIVTLDGKQWARIHFINPAGDQVLMMTHATGFDSYTIELNGTFQQLSEKKTILNKMMQSFNFPPSNYLLAHLESEE